MARVTSVRITNYRSVRGPLEIAVPESMPLVLIGENNAGKSNIVRATELVLGETWPGAHDPDDHEYFGRDSGGDPIQIRIGLEDVPTVVRSGEQKFVVGLRLVVPKPEDEEHALTQVFSNGDEQGWVSNDVRMRCLCLVVGADRRLSWHFSYTSKRTLLSKLMRQFHRSLTADRETVEELKEKYGEIITIFGSVPEFASFQAELDRQVADLSANFTYGLDIDFSAYDPSNFFHALRVQPTEAGEPRTFDELGTGQEQVLAIAFAHAYAKAFHGSGRSLLLVIEEPEAHLHPLAQEWLALKLRELARVDGIQVILTTHSPAFVSIADLPGLVLVRKEDGATTVKQLTFDELADACQAQGAARAHADTVGPFYEAAAAPEILAGLFARKVLLVEGPTEAAALPIYLRKVGIDPVRDGVAVVAVGGVGNLAKWLRFFNAYGVPTYVIFDNDARDDGDGVKKRTDLMTALGLDDESAQSLLAARTIEIRPGVCAFGRNFEESLRGLFGATYTDLERQGREAFGLSGEKSKPLLARFVAERVTLSEAESAYTALSDLAAALSELEARREA